MDPVKLPPNRVRRFYRGGRAIAALRGLEGEDEHAPEEWIGSTISVFGADETGLSRLPDGTPLRDAIAADPETYLGPEHVQRFGADPALLVKLLDGGERLPVHFHPDREFAARYLKSRYGKTEAWVIVGGGGEIRVGFRERVDPETVAVWVARQDTAAMLAALQVLTVGRGDTVFVPAGTPHAIGEGILMVELQEPTDFSVLLEWEGFAINGAVEGHLGLGFDAALAGLDRSAWSEERLAAVRGSRPAVADGSSGIERLFPPEADAFFRAEWIRPDPASPLPAEFSVLIVLDGFGVLVPASGSALALARGDAVLVPFAAGASRLEGSLDLVRCLAPAP